MHFKTIGCKYVITKSDVELIALFTPKFDSLYEHAIRYNTIMVLYKNNGYKFFYFLRILEFTVLTQHFIGNMK